MPATMLVPYYKWMVATLRNTILEELSMEYASKGVAGSGLGLGIAGTALGVLNGGLGNLLGGFGNTGNCNCHENMPVNRYEMELNQKNADLQSQIALRDANIYGDQKLLEVYKYFDGELKGIRNELCDQRVYNATNNAAIGCIQGQVAQLYGLTKLVVPNTSVCPGWGNVTITPATTPTTAG
jgi:hypothetical protein